MCSLKSVLSIQFDRVNHVRVTHRARSFEYGAVINSDKRKAIKGKVALVLPFLTGGEEV
jgi:hypothetical protein